MDERVRKVLENRLQKGRAILEVVEGPDTGRVARVGPEEEALLGREPTCTLRLTDAAVAPLHARIRSNGTEVVLFAVEGAGEVFVGADRVEYRILCPGDEIRLGGTRILVREDESKPAGPEEAMKLARQVIRHQLADASAVQEAIREWEDARGRGPAPDFATWLAERGVVAREALASLAATTLRAAPAAATPPGAPFPPPGDFAISPEFLDPDLVERVRARLGRTGAADEPLLLSELAGSCASLTRQQANRVLDLQFDLERIREIDGYRYRRLVGAGSAGFVFEAVALATGRTVALKIIRPELLHRESTLKRFLRESRILTTLDHPNLIRGYDVGASKGLHYLAMEYVVGESLGARIKRAGPIPEPEALSILTQIARAMVHAEEKGVLHRDVKPANILLLADGTAKLCDMGLAKMCEAGISTSLTASGFVVGTPDYISPEQAQGAPDIDVRADIYSLGATLYHALTGTPPFHHPSAIEVMIMHIQEPLIPPRTQRPDLSPFIDSIIVRMMAKSPEDRFAGPRELLEALEE